MHFILTLISKLLQLLLSSVITLTMIGLVGCLGLYAYYAQQLPDINQLHKMELQVPMRIYTHDKRLLAEYGEQRRQITTFEELPERLVNAFISIEDSRFYEHQGIDYKGIARALLSAITTGSVSQGASTITMQLARNAFLSKEKTLDRKLREALLSFEIERQYSKEQIIELYLNTIYFGKRAYGIGAAAETYYGKTLNELTLAQTAMIAGLPKAPSAYNPIANPRRALIRRNYILKRMLQFDCINQAEFQQATAEPITAKVHRTEIEVDSPFMAEMVRSAIVKHFGKKEAYSQGYNVYTTLDVEKQKQLEDSLRQGLLDYDRRHGYRGPEAVIDLANFPQLERLIEELSQYPVVGALEPAVVLEVSKSKARVLMLNEKLVTLTTKDVKWARKFISANRRGRQPYRVDHVMKPGDVIRLRKVYKDETKDKKKAKPKKEDSTQIVADIKERPFTWQFTQIPEVSGAMVLMDPKDGAIRASMGSFDFKVSKFNRALQARRQPGSSFKPFVYAAALAKGYTPSSIVNDAPIKLKNTDWKPKNFNGRYIGPTSLKEALAKSRNLVVIRLMRAIGVDYTINYATLFGFQKNRLPRNLTLSLGTGLTTPLEMATAYSTFANGGYRVNSYFITRIEDIDGNLLFDAKPQEVCGDEHESCLTPEEKQTLADLEQKAKRKKLELAFNKVSKSKKTDKKSKEAESNNEDSKKLDTLPKTVSFKSKTEIDEWLKVQTQKITSTPNEMRNPAAFRVMNANNHLQMVSMLQAVTQMGTARYATRTLKRKDIAGKTGTTNNERDAWFCGFSKDYVVATWVGFDDMAKLGKGETATRVALPIWTDFMGKLLKDEPEYDWKKGMPLKQAKAENKSTKKATQQATRRATPPAQAFQYRPSVLPATQNQRQQPVTESVEIPEQIF